MEALGCTMNARLGWWNYLHFCLLEFFIVFSLKSIEKFQQANVDSHTCMLQMNKEKKKIEKCARYIYVDWVGGPYWEKLAQTEGTPRPMNNAFIFFQLRF